MISNIRSGYFTSFALISDLNLEGNSVDHISCDTFSDCPELEKLNLRSNQLTTLPCVVSNPETWSLQELNLANNSLTGSHDPLVAAHLRNVTALDLSRNAGLTSLENLITEMPYIETLELFHTPKLEYNAQVFRNNRNLKSIDCVFSALTIMPLFGAAKATIASLRFLFNEMECVDVEHIIGLHSATSLNFEKNALKAFPDVGCSNQSTSSNIDDINFPSLKIIRLANNLITKFPLLPGMPNSSVISIPYNRLRQFPAERMALITRVRELRMSHNNAAVFPNFSLEPHYAMTVLELNHNRIFSVPANRLAPLTSIKHLHLNHNNITEIPDLLFAHQTLIKFSIHHNGINDLQPMILSSGKKWKLTYLDVSYNMITQIPQQLLHQFDNIAYLILSNNQIGQMPFMSVVGPTLRDLQLGYNNLTYIPDNCLLGMRMLRSLNLEHNFIHTFPFWRLSDGSLPSIRLFKLNNNDLTNLPNLDNFLIDESLTLNVKSNKFNCTYEICWLKTFERFKLLRDDKLCWDPPALLGKSFQNINFVDLGCYCKYWFIKTLRPRQIVHHFADYIFEYIFLNKNVWILIQIPLKIGPNGQN